MSNLTEQIRQNDLIPVMNTEEEPGKKIRYTGNDPLIGKMWNTALCDVEKNYCMNTEYGTVFAAGGYGEHFNWKGLTFNRDTSYSGLLALNALYPQEMLTSMKIIRCYRRKLAFHCTPETEIEGISGVQVVNVNFEEFKRRFHKGTAINKTDDVVWIWSFYDLMQKNHLQEEQWLYETAKYDFEHFYNPFYDETDGLYFGQPTFIDVGSNGYPDSFGLKTKEAYNNGVWVKASSTNALYYKALTIMGKTADKLGLEEEAQEWMRRAENLKKAIRESLRSPDGTFCYFKHRDGHLENRREVLGTAFCVLNGIVEGQEAKDALKDYPITAFGAPLIFPYYENDRVLHNNSAWPFADTFLLLATEKAYGIRLVNLNLQIMVNDSVNGHIGEFRNMILNQMCGAKAQLWSISGFLNACIRGGLTELKKETVRIS